MKRCRGQLFTWDLIFASALFLLNLYVVIYFWEASVSGITQDRVIQDMGWKVDSVGEKLVRTFGAPFDWESGEPVRPGDVEVFGLAEDEVLYGSHRALNRVLDPDKVVKFAQLGRYDPDDDAGYEETRKRLLGGGQYDFFVSFSCVNDSSVDCFGGLFFDSVADGNVTCSNGYNFQVFGNRTYQYYWLEAESFLADYVCWGYEGAGGGTACNYLGGLTPENCKGNCSVSNDTSVMLSPYTQDIWQWYRFDECDVGEPGCSGSGDDGLPLISLPVSFADEYSLWVRLLDKNAFPYANKTNYTDDHNLTVYVYELDAADPMVAATIRVTHDATDQGSFQWYQVFDALDFPAGGTYPLAVMTPMNTTQYADLGLDWDVPVIDAFLFTNDNVYDPRPPSYPPVGNPIRNKSCVVGRPVDLSDPFLTDVVTDYKYAVFSGEGLEQRVLSDHEVEMKVVLYKGEAPVIPPSTVTTTIQPEVKERIWIDCSCDALIATDPDDIVCAGGDVAVVPGSIDVALTGLQCGSGGDSDRVNVTVNWTGYHNYDDNAFTFWLDGEETGGKGLLGVCVTQMPEMGDASTEEYYAMNCSIPSNISGLTGGVHYLDVVGDDSRRGYCHPNEAAADSQLLNVGVDFGEGCMPWFNNTCVQPAANDPGVSCPADWDDVERILAFDFEPKLIDLSEPEPYVLDINFTWRGSHYNGSDNQVNWGFFVRDDSGGSDEYTHVTNCSTTNESHVEIEPEKYYYASNGSLQLWRDQLEVTSDIGYKCWDLNVTSEVLDADREHIAYPYVFDRWSRTWTGEGYGYVEYPREQLRIREGSCEQNMQTDPQGSFAYPTGIGNIPFTVSNSSSVCTDMSTMDNCTRVGVVMDLTVPDEFAGTGGPYYYNMSYYWDYPSGEDPQDNVFVFHDDFSHNLFDVEPEVIGTGTYGNFKRYWNFTLDEDRIPVVWRNVTPCYIANVCGYNCENLRCWNWRNEDELYLFAGTGLIDERKWFGAMTDYVVGPHHGSATVRSPNSCCETREGAEHEGKFGIILFENDSTWNRSRYGINKKFLTVYVDYENNFTGFRYVYNTNITSFGSLYLTDESEEVGVNLCDSPDGYNYENEPPAAWWTHEGGNEIALEWEIEEDGTCRVWANGELTCEGNCFDNANPWDFNPDFGIYDDYPAQEGPIGFFVKAAGWGRTTCSMTCTCHCQYQPLGGRASLDDLVIYPLQSDINAYSNENLTIQTWSYWQYNNAYPNVTLPWPRNMTPSYYDLVLTGEGYPFGVCDLDIGDPDDWMAVTPGLAVRD